METKHVVGWLGLVIGAFTIGVVIGHYQGSDKREHLAGELTRTIAERNRLEGKLETLQLEREHIVEDYVPEPLSGEPVKISGEPGEPALESYQLDLSMGAPVDLFDGELTVEVQEMKFVPSSGGYEALVTVSRLGKEVLNEWLATNGTASAGGFEVKVVSTRPRGAQVQASRSAAERSPLG